MSHGLSPVDLTVRFTLRKNIILFRIEAFLFQAGRDFSHWARQMRAHPIQFFLPLGFTLSAVFIVQLEAQHNLLILSAMSFTVGVFRGGR